MCNSRQSLFISLLGPGSYIQLTEPESPSTSQALSVHHSHFLTLTFIEKWQTNPPLGCHLPPVLCLRLCCGCCGCSCGGCGCVCVMWWCCSGAWWCGAAVATLDPLSYPRVLPHSCLGARPALLDPPPDEVLPVLRLPLPISRLVLPCGLDCQL